MRDVFQQNYPAVTGSPSLIAGPLTDGTQALRLGNTDTWVVTDSASSSLTIADAAAGGAAMTGWFSLPSIPGSTQTILGKASSYELKVTNAGKLQWIITNGGNSVTVTSTATIATNTWYHFAGVYNGDYTGTTIFGNQSTGTLMQPMLGDLLAGSGTGSNNVQVCKFAALEKGTTTSVVIDLRRVHDATLNETIRAVVYGPNTSTIPGALLGSSADVLLSTASVPARTFLVIPTVAAFYAGDVWLGYEGTESSGQFEIGYESAGGQRATKADTYSGGAPDPFGTPAATDANKFAVYANYTATGRTGAEGKALIYLNGLLDNSSAYAHGIADTANNLQKPSGQPVDLKDWAIWNRKLTAVEVATEYACR